MMVRVIVMLMPMLVAAIAVWLIVVMEWRMRVRAVMMVIVITMMVVIYAVKSKAVEMALFKERKNVTIPMATPMMDAIYVDSLIVEMLWSEMMSAQMIHCLKNAMMAMTKTLAMAVINADAQPVVMGFYSIKANGLMKMVSNKAIQSNVMEKENVMEAVF